MKKVLFFACAAALCLAVASCGNNQAAEEEVATEAVEAVEAADACCGDSCACAECDSCACCAADSAAVVAE